MTDGAPPGSIDERLGDEYRSARQRMGALVADFGADHAARPVPACPDWSVADLLAHVTGLAVVYGSGTVPDGDRQLWLDSLVAERRGRTLGVLVEEWDIVAPALERVLAERPTQRWPLVYDVIAHEHDLRGALDRPGERDGDSVRLGLQLGLRITAADLARHGLPGITVVADAVQFVAGNQPAELTLEATTFEAFRLLGSRRTLAELHAARITGDLDRFLPALVHMSLPTDSLGERR